MVLQCIWVHRTILKYWIPYDRAIYLRPAKPLYKPELLILFDYTRIWTCWWSERLNNFCSRPDGWVMGGCFGRRHTLSGCDFNLSLRSCWGFFSRWILLHHFSKSSNNFSQFALRVYFLIRSKRLVKQTTSLIQFSSWLDDCMIHLVAWMNFDAFTAGLLDLRISELGLTSKPKDWQEFPKVSLSKWLPYLGKQGGQFACGTLTTSLRLRLSFSPAIGNSS